MTDHDHDHHHDAGRRATDTDEWERRLRSQGYRITPQRQLVLEAVETLRHGTPDELLVEVQKTASGVNLSTAHIHLVCDGCEKVISVDADVAEPLVRVLGDTVGFDTDITHFSVHGRCAECRAATTLA